MGSFRDDEFLRRNQRQRQAILAYIRAVTGREPEQVPREEQNRLALEWIKKHGHCFK